jgi:hypothetical protein
MVLFYAAQGRNVCSLPSENGLIGAHVSELFKILANSLPVDYKK